MLRSWSCDLIAWSCYLIMLHDHVCLLMLLGHVAWSCYLSAHPYQSTLRTDPLQRSIPLSICQFNWQVNASLYIYWPPGPPGSSDARPRRPHLHGRLLRSSTHQFSHRFWRWVFSWFWCPFGLNCWWFFNAFCTTFSSIDLALIFHRCWDGFCFHFWCFFDDVPVRAPTMQNLDFLMTLQ